MWQDWRVLSHWVAYIGVHLIMFLGISLIGPEDHLATYKGQRQFCVHTLRSMAEAGEVPEYCLNELAVATQTVACSRNRISVREALRGSSASQSCSPTHSSVTLTMANTDASGVASAKTAPEAPTEGFLRVLAASGSVASEREPGPEGRQALHSEDRGCVGSESQHSRRSAWCDVLGVQLEAHVNTFDASIE